MGKSRIILSDCDGCLLNWSKGFEQFATERGYPRMPNTEDEYRIHTGHNIPLELAQSLIKEFNEGPNVAHLESFADSVEYVGKLVKLGFTFIVVTSIGNHPDSKIYRTQNLIKLFGDIFNNVVCLPMDASKASVLMQWADTGYFWIEDHMRHAEAGWEAGLQPLLIDHPYNKHYSTDLFPKISVKDPWKEIHRRVCEEYNLPI